MRKGGERAEEGRRDEGRMVKEGVERDGGREGERDGGREEEGRRKVGGR